jgi:hypothetical protein
MVFQVSMHCTGTAFSGRITGAKEGCITDWWQKEVGWEDVVDEETL